MISRRLSIAIAEAIQVHADQNSQGKTNLLEVMAAIGEVASDFLADIADHGERMATHSRLCRAMAQATLQKATDRVRHITEHLH